MSKKAAYYRMCKGCEKIQKTTARKSWTCKKCGYRNRIYPRPPMKRAKREYLFPTSMRDFKDVKPEN